MTKNKVYQLNCKGRLLTFSSPIIMGIINTTPDSFFADSRKQNISATLASVEQMLSDGATIIDIGGMSSRPGAIEIPESKELDNVLQHIRLIKQTFPESIISIDTYRSEVARLCIEAGADIINDISGGLIQPNIIDIAATYQTPFICMHMQGNPQTMQLNPTYDDVVSSVYTFLQHSTQQIHAAGVHDVIIDVGFGFGKTQAHNFALLKSLSLFKQLAHPILVGISRKGMIYKTLGITPDQALNGTTALHMYALEQGANILRVHDVKAAHECIQLWTNLQ